MRRDIVARRHRSAFSPDRVEIVVLLVIFALLVVTLVLWLDVLLSIH